MSSQPFKDHFSSTAADYAAHRPTYPMALVDFLAASAPGQELAWDAGCGSGQISTLLADRFARVLATDASAEQIARATRRDNITYREARAEVTGLEAGSTDLAVAAQAAHWFDLERYYAEVRRVLRSGGVLALVTYGILVVDAGLDPIIEPFYFGILGPHWPPERRLVEEGYRSLPFPFQEFSAPPFEIGVQWTLPELLGYVNTWSAVQALLKSEGRAPLERFTTALTGAWGSPATVRAVRWPISLRVGRS